MLGIAEFASDVASLLPGRFSFSAHPGALGGQVRFSSGPPSSPSPGAALCSGPKGHGPLLLHPLPELQRLLTAFVSDNFRADRRFMTATNSRMM